MKEPKELYDWHITLAVADGEAGAASMTGARRSLPLGRVRARTAEEAIITAIREFGIEEARQNRLIATRVD